jgi:hypothetical protein
METLLDVNKEVGLEVNTEKTKFMSYHQNAEQNYNIKVANKFFRHIPKFRYLAMTVTDQNYIHEEIRSRMLATVQFRIFCLPASSLKM